MRPQDVEEVYRSTRKDCLQQALVLEAAGIDYEIRKHAGEFTLVVAAYHAARAREEFEASARENRDWPVRARALPQQAGGWEGVFAYVAVLLLFWSLEHHAAFGFDWFGAGKTQAALIRDGQWWRAVTALTLHVDLAHLVANLVFGGLVGLFAGQLLGSGVAWAAILIAGAGGNLLNAWIRHPGHTSVGASTAVFATLGIVAAYAWLRRRDMQHPILMRIAPLVGAVVLLGLLGTGGERTDVGAHVTGFLSGLLLGSVVERLGPRMVLARNAQFLLGLGALATLAAAWALALAPQAS